VKKILISFAAAAAILAAHPAHALTFDFSFTNTAVGGVPGTVSGVIEGVTPTFSSATDIIIQSEPAGLGLTLPIDAIKDANVNHFNIFEVVNGEILLTFVDTGQAPTTWLFCIDFPLGLCTGEPHGPGYDNFLVNLATGAFVGTNNPPIFTLTTPLPAALPFFATGLGGLGLLGWRRKRKTQAAA
jgi:hypothetical protein